MGSMFNNKNEMENPGMSDRQYISELDFARIFRSITDFHLILNLRFKINEINDTYLQAQYSMRHYQNILTKT
jgi:hypothetical protein